MILQYSATYGRGLLGPLYDDVVYLTDGLEHANLLRTQGVRACLTQLWVKPPHSPFGTFLAGASFVVFGSREWAPYALMGLVVLALLLVVDWLMDDLALPARLAGALFALSFPLTGTLPYYFRPDATSGLLTGLGAVLMVRESAVGASRRHQMMTGLCFALALLVKTPSFLFTLYMFVGSWLVSALWGANPQLVDSSPTETRAARRWWPAVWPYWLPVLLLAGPYYILAGADTLRYVHENMFGENKEIWRLKGTWPELARFVWDGPAGQLMLGQHKYVVVALGALTAIAYLTTGVGLLRARVNVVLSLGSILFLAWLMPTASRYNNSFIGSTFAAILLFVGVLLLRALFLLDRQSPLRWTRGIPIGALIAWGGVLAAILVFPWPQKLGTKATDWIVTDNRVEREVYQAIAKAAADGNFGLVYVTSAANGLNEHLLRFRALSEQLPLRFFSLPYSTDIAEHVKAIEKADYVVAGDQGTFRDTPATSYQVQDQILAAVKLDPSLHLLTTVSAYEGLNFYLFGRQPAFGGWTAAAGLGPPEGPFAPAGGRMVRWGLGPKTVLTLTSETQVEGVVEFTSLTMTGGQTVELFVNGQTIARVTLEPGDGFRHAKCLVKWSAGPNRVELRYARWEDRAGAPPMAVLFKELRVS